MRGATLLIITAAALLTGCAAVPFTLDSVDVGGTGGRQDADVSTGLATSTNYYGGKISLHFTRDRGR